MKVSTVIPCHDSNGDMSTAELESQSPLFSVVIPTYNRADLLRQALESVFRQEFRDFEVIVVDDGSREDQSEVMEEYRGRITFLRQENAGPGAARNRGAAVARGEYLAFLDSDDVWFPWTLRTYFYVIQTADFPALIVGKRECFQEVKELQLVSGVVGQYRHFRDFYSSSSLSLWLGASALTIRRATFLATQGFVPGVVNAEDLDLVMQIGTARGLAVVNSPATFGYREHAGSMTRDIGQTLTGISRLIDGESVGRYPGRKCRARERIAILTRSVRPPSLSALAHRRFRDAVSLYWRALPWHLQQLRFKYLIGFWIYALRCVLLFRRRPAE
jgi:hypothetical protein